jgi:hypothetical protein
MSTLSHTIQTLSDRRYLASYTATMRPLVLREAVELYLARRDRRSHPAGSFDSAHRWYPTAQERCDCCDVRRPSRAYPYSLLVHCRTAEHIAHLYGIAYDDLAAAIRRAEDRGGDEAKSYRAWLQSRAHLSPLVDYSGEGKLQAKTR